MKVTMFGWTTPREGSDDPAHLGYRAGRMTHEQLAYRVSEGGGAA